MDDLQQWVDGLDKDLPKSVNVPRVWVELGKFGLNGRHQNVKRWRWDMQRVFSSSQTLDGRVYELVIEVRPKSFVLKHSNSYLCRESRPKTTKNI